MIIYSSPACPKCDTLKEKLKLKGIEFTEVNVAENASAKNELVSLGFRSVPQVKRDDYFLTHSQIEEIQ